LRLFFSIHLKNNKNLTLIIIDNQEQEQPLFEGDIAGVRKSLNYKGLAQLETYGKGLWPNGIVNF
jgi:hypothetical protein